MAFASDISTDDLARYRAHLSNSTIAIAQQDEMIRALHTVLTTIIDIAWNTSDVQIVKNARLADSFQNASKVDSNLDPIMTLDYKENSKTRNANRQKVEETRHDIA